MESHPEPNILNFRGSVDSAGARRRVVAQAVLVTAAMIATVVSLSSCGGGDTTTIIERTNDGPVTETSTTPPTGPEGELTAVAVGPAEQGMSLSEVRALFGPADHTKRFPGCELNPSSKPTLAWIWDLPDGSMTLDFDAASGRLASYRTTSPGFPTTNGNRIGDSFQTLKDSWGASLRPLSLGVASTPRSGYWYVRDGPKAELLFAVAGGKVTSIAGGNLPVCE